MRTTADVFAKSERGAGGNFRKAFPTSARAKTTRRRAFQRWTTVLTDDLPSGRLGVD
ncbi:MAG: hypothetical protein ACEY26_01005 [Candidatus Hodgkinia cicadicola]